jgi:DNA-binding NarL/FixJ family response regulator
MNNPNGLRHLIFEAAVDMGLTMTTAEIAQLAHLVVAKAAQREQIPTVLQPRLADVLHGLAVGESTEETAARLHISNKTVKSHRCRLYKRLRAKSPAHAVAMAAQHGLLKPIGGAR